jgi:hypothetical protein
MATCSCRFAASRTTPAGAAASAGGGACAGRSPPGMPSGCMSMIIGDRRMASGFIGSVIEVACDRFTHCTPTRRGCPRIFAPAQPCLHQLEHALRSKCRSDASLDSDALHAARSRQLPDPGCTHLSAISRCSTPTADDPADLVESLEMTRSCRRPPAEERSRCPLLPASPPDPMDGRRTGQFRR